MRLETAFDNNNTAFDGIVGINWTSTRRQPKSIMILLTPSWMAQCEGYIYILLSVDNNLLWRSSVYTS